MVGNEGLKRDYWKKRSDDLAGAHCSGQGQIGLQALLDLHGGKPRAQDSLTFAPSCQRRHVLFRQAGKSLEILPS